MFDAINSLEPPARALMFLALTLLTGLPITLAAAVLPVLHQAQLPADAVMRRARHVLAFATVMLMVGAVVLGVAQLAPLKLSYHTAAEWLAFASKSLLMQTALARLALGALAALALVMLRRRSGWLTACVLMGLLAQATLTRTSHSTAMNAGALPIAADYAHLTGSAVWAGGLVALVLAVPSLLNASAIGATKALIQRYSLLGMLGVGLIVSAGLVLSSTHVPSASTLTSTGYGVVLVAKIAATVVAVALAGWHKFALAKRMHAVQDVATFARSLRVETGVVLAVVLMAALLTSASPPHKTMTHTMADGTTMKMSMIDPDFQRLLTIGAVCATAAAGFGLALNWRERRTQNKPS